jgi:hypothetical protein
LREYGYEGDIKIVPNGVDAFKPHNAEDLKRKAVNEYGLGKGLTFLFVGQIILRRT